MKINLKKSCALELYSSSLNLLNDTFLFIALPGSVYEYENRSIFIVNHLPLMHAFSVHDVNPDSEHVHVLHPSVEG